MININNRKILMSLMVGLSLITVMNNAVNAQGINRTNGQPDPFQRNEKNPLYGDGINPLDLIHNANFLNGRNSADFAEDTNVNINNAAQDFKRQQQQRMLEMQKKSPESTEIIDN